MNTRDSATLDRVADWTERLRELIDEGLMMQTQATAVALESTGMAVLESLLSACDTAFDECGVELLAIAGAAKRRLLEDAEESWPKGVES